MVKVDKTYQSFWKKLKEGVSLSIENNSGKDKALGWYPSERIKKKE